MIEVSMHHTEHFVHTDLILFVKIKWCSDVTTVIDRLFKIFFFFPFSRMLWLSCALQYFRVGWCNSVFKKSHVVLICSTKYDSLPILGVSHQKLGIVEFKFAKAIWFQSWVTISVYIYDKMKIDNREHIIFHEFLLLGARPTESCCIVYYL